MRKESAAMARRMIEIEPGTASWDAWLDYHRGTKTELVMQRCRHAGRAFTAWTEFPPERAHSGGMQLPKKHEPIKSGHVTPTPADGEIEQIAERLEARERRDAKDRNAAAARADKLQILDTARERAAAAVQIGIKPKVGDLPDVGIRMVDDPYEVKNGRKPKPLRAKMVNLRDDPVGQMAKRHQVSEMQLEAARRWQALHDVAASVGLTGGMDPFAVKVSGGRMADPINDSQIGAMKELQRLDAQLGTFGAGLVRRVLGDRMTVAQVADITGRACGSERAVQTESERLGWRLRECLDTLVDVIGVKVKGRGKPIPKQHAEMAGDAKYADHPALYQAVRAARGKIV